MVNESIIEVRNLTKTFNKLRPAEAISFNVKNASFILEPQEETVQVLIRLGLTCNQARVYLALVRSGMCTAKTMSNVSKVAREDVYRIIPKLQELGMIEERIDVPSVYAAAPMQEAFRILMKNRKRVTTELEAKTKEIIQNFKNGTGNGTGKPLEEDTHEFILIPKERAVIKRKRMIDDAQKRLDFLTSWGRYAQSNVSYTENLRNAMKRNVVIRIIVGKPKDEKSLLDLAHSWREKYPFFNVRWISSVPEACLMLVDEKKVLFAKSAANSFEESPFLWSTNQSLISVVRDYFEMIWLTSSEIKT
jgi:sugar-specific transcriptional regulator TrmB